LEFGELDEQADWTRQLLADNEVLLPASLYAVRRDLRTRMWYSRLQAEPADPCGPCLCSGLHLPGAPLLRWLWQAANKSQK
jgi:O-methyltransferase involved in polyketide biosynthesis